MYTQPQAIVVAKIDKTDMSNINWCKSKDSSNKKKMY